MDVNKGLLGLLFFVVAAMFVVSIVAIDGSLERDDEQRDTISVSGTQVMEVVPDQAVIMLDVSTRGKDAAQVSADNKALVNKVMVALAEQGVAPGSIETTGLSLHRWNEWNGKEQINEDLGYEQINSIKITTENLDKVGRLVDAAVGAGANSVQDVAFKLKDATEQRYKQEAMAQAAAIAQKKAQVLASAAGAELGDVISISESGDYQPWYYNARTTLESAAAGSATQISPQKVSLSVTVSMSYELEQ
ncbi:TPA: SIMPL domain-containing protein [Candidatus Woesearchaeota archaeon]|nr:SIMPL domain-containing protein [Candidatus Woesearchaeota archaeon]